jgi:hypothetical protein
MTIGTERASRCLTAGVVSFVTLNLAFVDTVVTLGWEGSRTRTAAPGGGNRAGSREVSVNLEKNENSLHPKHTLYVVCHCKPKRPGKRQKECRGVKLLRACADKTKAGLRMSDVRSEGRRAESGSNSDRLAVVLKLPSRCGMISGAGSLDTAIAGLVVCVSPAPEATCNRDSNVRAAAVRTQSVPRLAGDSLNPVSNRNRMNQVFGSDLVDPAAAWRTHRVDCADAGAAV